ncbi:MAG: hypothetical protein ACLP1W_12990 [Rhodomicrobium sp.]
MSKKLLLIFAVIFCASIGQADAKGILLKCKLGTGTKLAFEIDKNRVLKGGRPLKKLDKKSVAIGAQYVTFQQRFTKFRNEWSFDRNSRELSFKTILVSNLRVVLDEEGSCVYTKVALKAPASKPAKKLSGPKKIQRPPVAATLRRDKAHPAFENRTAWIYDFSPAPPLR